MGGRNQPPSVAIGRNQRPELTRRDHVRRGQSASTRLLMRAGLPPGFHLARAAAVARLATLGTAFECVPFPRLSATERAAVEQLRKARLVRRLRLERCLMLFITRLGADLDLVHLMREAIRGHQRSSVVIIRRDQWPSEVIIGNQRSSEVIRGHQWSSSEATSGHQRPSEVIIVPLCPVWLRSGASCPAPSPGSLLLASDSQQWPPPAAHPH